MRVDTKKLAMMGLFTALAMIFGYVEAILPISVGIPGVKLGLANIVVLFALYYLKPSEAFLINIVRIILVSFMFGNLSVMLYSLAGGVLSFGAMLLFKKSGKFSVYGVSVAGGVFHNVGQLLVAMLVLETMSLVYYGPVLLISGVVTGLVIGIVSSEVIKRIGNH
ncbi:MAG: Gx transporter family protein [Lachnospiraceae bacterium]|nr:Gx transporter family protein [Lachnospiraceae bacterium]